MTNKEKIKVIRENIMGFETDASSRKAIRDLDVSIYIDDSNTIKSAEKVLYFEGNRGERIPLKKGVNFDKTYRIINHSGSIDLIVTMMEDGSNAWLWNKRGYSLVAYPLNH